MQQRCHTDYCYYNRFYSDRNDIFYGSIIICADGKALTVRVNWDENGIQIGTEKGIQQGIEIGKEESIKELAITFIFFGDKIPLEIP